MPDEQPSVTEVDAADSVIGEDGMQRSGDPQGSVVAATSGTDWRARPERRWVPLLLLGAGQLAFVLAAMGVTSGPVGNLRMVATAAFLLVGPGWAVVGFLHRAPASITWILAVAASAAFGAVIGLGMALLRIWQPELALFLMVALCSPVLIRHAVVAQ